jgi:hypothetical protein
MATPTPKAKKTGDSAAAVQVVVDDETERGFLGVEVDTTPNHAYTVAGVTAGEPTPETDGRPSASD